MGLPRGGEKSTPPTQPPPSSSSSPSCSSPAGAKPAAAAVASRTCMHRCDLGHFAKCRTLATLIAAALRPVKRRRACGQAAGQAIRPVALQGANRGRARTHTRAQVSMSLAWRLDVAGGQLASKQTSQPASQPACLLACQQHNQISASSAASDEQIGSFHYVI